MRTNIKPLGRLLVHTLLAKADNDTAVVAARHTPSLSTLVASTGMARSAVAEHLTYLEGLHWVKRSRSAAASRGDRTQYALFIGQEDPARPSSPPETGPPCGLVREADDQRPAETESVVRPADQSKAAPSPPDGPEVVRDTDSGSPQGGHATSTTTKTNTKNSSTKSSRPRVDDIPRPDVDEICAYLADKIEGNGSKRPSITATWRKEARLLLDQPRPSNPNVDKVKALIDWCQDSSCFWHKTVHSMESFREKYDRIRLDALDDFNRKKQSGRGARASPGAGSSYVNPSNREDAYTEDV